MLLKCIRPPTPKSNFIKEIHVFDLDRTLALPNTSLLFARYLKEKDVINRFEWMGCVIGYIFYRTGITSMNNQMRSTFARFFKGKSAQVMAAFLPSFWQESLSKNMRTSLCDYMNQIKKRGEVVAIFSASPDFIVEWIAKKLDVHFVLASQCELDEAKCFDCLGVIATGEVKANAAQNLKYLFPKARTYGYSDSIDDLKFLEDVDCPYVVSPDSKLKKWAKTLSHVKEWID